ncbi:MAG: ABC transporter substrate-binding protein [Candidatus Hermodarchaeota archaeon]
MSKNSIKLLYIFLGVIVISSFSFLYLNSHNSNNSFFRVDDTEAYPDINDIMYVPFVVGVPSGPITIDPVDSFDHNSWNVIDQVCEGLFRYNMTDPDMPRINLLAESYWWENKTTLRLKLREGIMFHDNTPFNANAAKWNLERINYLCNATGTLPDTMDPAFPNSLWKFQNGTAIMKQIEYVSEYNITIHLNSPFSPFLNLLCFSGATMISPSSHSQTDYIDLSSGVLVGTGPFVYDNYITDIEVNFHAFDSYWRGEANITAMKFSIIGDSYARNFAMLYGNIDYLYNPTQEFYLDFITDSDIVFAEAPKSGLTYYYLGMNNNKINVTWRKAISYAVNYSYIIQNLRDNHAERAYSPISSGFGETYYNCSDIAPYYNLTIARQTLIDDPKIDTTGLTANDNPDDTAWENANLGIFNYSSYNYGFWSDLYLPLVDWCDDIGITILDNRIDYNSFNDLINNYKHKLSLFSSGWGLDYFDAFNMIDPLFSNSSNQNLALVNDPWLQMKLTEVIKTTDDDTRNYIYHDIQINFSSILYPHAFLFHPRQYFVYNINLENYPHNALGRLYFYPCEWPSEYIITPPTISLNMPVNNEGFNDIAPNFDLSISLDYISIWYTLDNGMTNTTCGSSGQINSTLWGALDDNVYTLSFYANNSKGLIGTAAVSIYKDTTDPIIVINDPNPDQRFIGTIPNFDITVTELHLNNMWYTMDNGITNIPITTSSGTIDRDEWRALPTGNVTITFFAYDDVGNIGFSSVTVVKQPQGIPGPYAFLILMITTIGISGLIWRLKHKIIRKDLEN